MTEESLIEPEEPKSVGLLSNNDVILGKTIPAIDRLKIVSDEDFEDIIREWISGYCKVKYSKVRKPAGAGDKGRDVIAYIGGGDEWDNYQCKHYDHPLYPVDIWTELGKICYYTYKKDYILPKRYYFVSPQGVGNTLGDLLDKPIELRKGLIKEWDSKCKDKITSILSIELTTEFIAYIEAMDFSIFSSLDPQELIEQHKQTSYYSARFGGGLRRRTKPVINSIQNDEMLLRYVDQLFEAYTEHSSEEIKSIEKLITHNELHSHFNRQRECFYWADALNQFSRDSLPTGNTCFDDLKEEIYHGVADTCSSLHQNGYEKCVKTTQEATKLTLQSNALLDRVQVQDKIGICHHLINENKLTWVKK